MQYWGWRSNTKVRDRISAINESSNEIRGQSSYLICYFMQLGCSNLYEVTITVFFPPHNCVQPKIPVSKCILYRDR